MHLKTVAIALAVVVISFVVSLKLMDFVAPRGDARAPALVELPPLPPAPRLSTVMAPIAIALSAIRDAADRSAPPQGRYARSPRNRWRSREAMAAAGRSPPP